MIKRNSGFTLIEILVVMAIISLLAAIIFPVFSRAREIARRSTCQSNLKQIGIGILQYTQDFDERYPMSEWSGSTQFGWANSWRRVTYPYVKSTQVFSCPSNAYRSSPAVDSEAARLAALVAGGVTDPPVFGRSYAINGATSSIGGTPLTNVGSPTFMPSSLSSIPDSAQTIMVGEYEWTDAQLNFGNTNALNLNTVGLYFRGHLGTCNFLFVDGHVKALKPTDTGSPINMWNIETNTYDAGANLMARLNVWTSIVNRKS